MSKDLFETQDWTIVWHGKVFCGNCGGIFDSSNTFTCSICNFTHSETQTMRMPDGIEREIPSSFMGAINWTTFLLLKLMREEWNRPINKELFENYGLKTSPRAMIVILFWTLFESLFDQLLSKGMENFPKKISEHLLKRHQQIGSRINTLYPLIFNSSFKDDISEAGFPNLDDFLKIVQEKRNLFIHGNPEDIDENLVFQTVINLQDVQTAWINLYNLKCAKK